MNYYDSVLKTYADAGMRSTTDWALAGRDVIDGSEPRASAPHRGAQVALYTRDQTHIRHKTTIQ
jgi:hypothetical protein